MKMLKILSNKKVWLWLSILTLAVMSLSCAKFLAESRTESPVGKQAESPVNEPKAENEFEGNAEDREKWFLHQRRYPFDKLPEDARRIAWESRPEDAAENLLGGAQWQAIGPRPTTSSFPQNWGLTSGRINAVTVSPANPQIVLVGGATGGVWRSADGGNSFISTSDSQVDLAVGSIAFAPSDANIVYAGMGDKGSNYFGSGVLKSTNAGQTWTRVSSASLPSPGRTSKISVNPTNPNIVYVTQYSVQNGGAGGFYYSTDGGVSWTRTLDGAATDLVQHPTQTNTLYASFDFVTTGTFAGGVFKSTDSGLTWNRIYTSPYNGVTNIKIAVTPAAPSNLYVLIGGDGTARVEVSVNDGATFTNRALGSGIDIGQFNYNCYLFVNPADANTIYIGTRDLWRTTDGGLNYTNITNNFAINGGYMPFDSKSHPDQHHFYQSPANPNTIYIANDGGLWRSNDNAANFTSLNASLGLTMFTSLDLHPTDATKSYGGTQDNGTQRRTGGTGWLEFTGGDGGQTVIDALDPSIVFSTYIFKDISRWTNDTNTFDGQVGYRDCSGQPGCQPDNVFGGDRVAFYPPFEGNGVNSNLYFGTYRLWVSTNRGNSWTAPGGATDLTNGGLVSAIGAARNNGITIYTGSDDGKLMVSTNGGANWTDRSAGIPNRTIKSIIVSPTNANVAYVTVSGFGSGHVFKTTNTGATWTDISGNLPDIPTNTLLISPVSATTLYVGTDVGVFRSTTDGTNWATFNNGMPPVIVTELDAQANGIMQAATYGRGAYQINLTATNRKPFDFDGDGRSDISVFRPSNGTWYLNQSTNGFAGISFGLNTDLIAPADFDGDGKTDVAVFRPSSGAWYYLQSSNNAFVGTIFGQNGDLPRPADFDGDGKADITVFRPANGAWYRLNSSNGSFFGTIFGQNGDKPLIADFDGDGKSDITVFRSATASFYSIDSSNGAFRAAQFGLTTDVPTMGDFDGDGKTDVAVFRPSSGAWYRLNSSNGAFFGTIFGQNGDIPVAADYDGDGKADIGVFRPGNGVWYYLNSSNGGFNGLGFGLGTDNPVPAAFQ